MIRYRKQWGIPTASVSEHLVFGEKVFLKKEAFSARIVRYVKGRTIL